MRKSIPQSLHNDFTYPASQSHHQNEPIARHNTTLKSILFNEWPGWVWWLAITIILTVWNLALSIAFDMWRYSFWRF